MFFKKTKKRSLKKEDFNFSEYLFKKIKEETQKNPPTEGSAVNHPDENEINQKINLRNCWFKEGKHEVPQRGKFHTFSQNFEEFQSGPGPYPVAIIETLDGIVFIVEAQYVSFSDEPKFSR